MSPGEISSRGTPRSTSSRQLVDRLFVGVCIVTAIFSVSILAILLLAILFQSASHFLSPTIHCDKVAAAPESQRGPKVEIVIERTPTGGHYTVQTADGEARVQLPFDAPGEKVQQALQQLPGLANVTVKTDGYSPNFKHTVDMSTAPRQATLVCEQAFRKHWLSLCRTFISGPPDPNPAKAGIYPAMLGTLWVCLVCALFALPIGVGTAILLEEFRPSKTWLRRLHGFVQLNISNLAGVPSVVYGILGLTAFVSCFNLLGAGQDAAYEVGVQYYDQFLSEGQYSLKIPVQRDDAVTVPQRDQELIGVFNRQRVRVNVIGADDPLPTKKSLLAVTLRESAVPGRIPDPQWYYLRLPFGRGVFAGALTLMLVVLPIVIIASQEALRAVPDSLREAALGMGASRWQTVWNVTLPASIPGIMTGAILAMSRAIGEAAPLLMISGVVFIPNAPKHLMAPFTVMPLQIYDWAGRPQDEYHVLAALGIAVLLAVLLLFNAVAVFIRNKMKKPLS